MSQLNVLPVDLDRAFIPINPDEPISTEAVEGRLFGLRSALTWSDLLERPRVVILAEASSGKTFEFERRVKRLRDEGKQAFFAPIEQLVEADLEVVLGREGRELFDAWQSSGQPAWFFLDSVDEAKLTKKSLDVALKRFEQSMGAGYARARILISCRGTDWAGASDLKRVSDALPAILAPQGAVDGEDPLLGRVSRNRKAPVAAESPPAFSVVSMAAFSGVERRKFLTEGARLPDVAGFEKAMAQKGLTPLASRPGDLLVLAQYWTTHKKLGSLTEMMEATADARLAERPERPDAKVLKPKVAREGAERIAAAMVLGRSMTITTGAPATGELGLSATLDDWAPEDQETLIRRGVFAAATYGKARFNHRALMEYLAAAWFKRLLAGGCPVSRIMAVFTAEPFGVPTIPPSLRAIAAWLAPHCAPLRRFILEHAPLTLLLHGDPAALAVADRAALLRRYAALDGAGCLSHTYADEHALWMFADPSLAPVIKAVWPEADDSFRFELLRLIEQGGLTDCAKLAEDAALNTKSGDYTRIIAARVLVQFGRTTALSRLVKALVAAPERLHPRVGPQLVAVLFPRPLGLKDLLALVDQAPRARRYEVEGFGYVLEALYASCEMPALKMAFVDGLAALCRQPPINERHEPVSKRHAPLARKVEALLVAVLKDVPSLGIWPGLVDLLWVAEAADLDSERHRHKAVFEGVRRHVALNEALFWRGIDRLIELNLEPRLDPLVLWRWQRLERRYWSIHKEDRPWLERAAKGQDELRRRVAFAALMALAEEGADATGDFAALRKRYGGDPQLMADLADYLKPRPISPDEVEFSKRQVERERALAAADAINHQSWRQLRDEVVAHPERLQDEGLFHRWKDFRPLISLLTWLSNGPERDRMKAVLTYPDLAHGFSAEVADAFRAGMLKFWRVAPPRGLTQRADGGTSRPWSSVLAIAGLALDAGATPDWISTLDAASARRAVRHVFISGLDFPDWLDALLTAFPAVVEPYVVRELQREWTRLTPAFSPLLYRAGANLPITPSVGRALLRLIEGSPYGDAEHLEHARKILRRLTLSQARRRALAHATRTRVIAAQAAADWEGAIALIPVLFVLDPAAAAADLRQLLAAQPVADRQARAEGALGALFGMSRGRVWGLRAMDEAVVADLLRLTYEYVRPEHDRRHDGSYTPDQRDDAETARNELLGALMNKPGERAFALMDQLLADGAFGVSTPQLHRLAQDMADNASEGGPWGPADIRRFELDNIEPITTGERLFALVIELIEDIDRDLRSEDVSARELLLTAKDEHAVQSWLASMLKDRAKGRFTVPIEAEAPARDRLDITVVANGGSAEVAVEMKHGGMDWTVPKLEASLSSQLAKRYLKPQRRRHGVFVISNHRSRRWKTDAGGEIGFAALIARLQRQAELLTTNSTGPIHVAVRGVDAVLPEKKGKARAAKTNGSPRVKKPR